MNNWSTLIGECICNSMEKCRCSEWTWFRLTDCADGPSEGWAGVEGGLRGIVVISFNRHSSTLNVDEPLECITVDCSRVVVEGGWRWVVFRCLKWHTWSFQSAHQLPMARWLRNTAIECCSVTGVSGADSTAI